jgi:hypothetical protein
MPAARRRCRCEHFLHRLFVPIADRGDEHQVRGAAVAALIDGFGERKLQVLRQTLVERDGMMVDDMKLPMWLGSHALQ